MPYPAWPVKDPNAVLDYGFDWGPWLTALTDTIDTSTWTVPAGITKVTDSHSTTKTTIWLSGGTVGTKYTLTNRIVTAGGRTDDRTVTVTVKER